MKDVSRREVLKGVAYVTPAIITLAVTPTFASRGSGWQHRSPPSYSERDKWGIGANWWAKWWEGK